MYAAMRLPTAVPFCVPSGSVSAIGSQTRAHPRSHSSMRASPSRRAMSFAFARKAARSRALVQLVRLEVEADLDGAVARARRRFVVELRIAVPPLRLPAAVLVLEGAEPGRDLRADGVIHGAQVRPRLHQRTSAVDMTA